MRKYLKKKQKVLIRHFINGKPEFEGEVTQFVYKHKGELVIRDMDNLLTLQWDDKRGRYYAEKHARSVQVKRFASADEFINAITRPNDNGDILL